MLSSSLKGVTVAGMTPPSSVRLFIAHLLLLCFAGGRRRIFGLSFPAVDFPLVDKGEHNASDCHHEKSDGDRMIQDDPEVAGVQIYEGNEISRENPSGRG